MKTKLIVVLAIILFQLCKAQQAQNALPKVEDYTKGELEIKQQLVKLKPISKEHYESWLPKKLGNLKRTSYEVGKKLERMPTTNNVNLLFEKDSKTIDLTIVDCAGNKDAVSRYTSMKDIGKSRLER